MADSRDIHKITDRKKPPLPVDRGWAWCVMISVYMILLILTAFARSLSIFLPDILDRYKEPAAVTTLAFGICDLSWSFTNIFMPIVLPRFSVRTLALCGAFFHCFGVIALAYSPNIIVFNCLFAVLGAASGLLVCPSMIHLGHYFKKRLSFACSVTQVGGSTATILVPSLAQYLKDEYGFQGALLILGGISFHCVAAAMLLWPVSMFEASGYPKEVQENNSKNYIEEWLDIDGVMMECYIKPLGKEQKEEGEIDEVSKDADINEESKLLQVEELRNAQIKGINYAPANWKEDINGQVQSERNCEAKPTQLIPLSEARFTRDTSQRIHNEIEKLSSLLPDLALDSQINRNTENNTQKEQSISCYNDNIEKDSNATLRESQENTTKCDQAEEGVYRSSIEETVSNQTSLIQDGPNHKQDCRTPSNSRGCCSLQRIKAVFSSSVLLNPVAVMLIMAGGLSTPGGNMYVPVLGLENGLSPDEVPWMLTVMGIADIFGKLGIGLFADLGYVRPIRIAGMAQLTGGLVFQFTTFYKGLGPMLGVAVIFGITNGVVQSLMSPMVVELLGLQYLAQVTPVVYLVMGLFTFVLNVTVGAIKDATGSFFSGFNFLGGMMLTTFLILLLEPVFVRCSGKFSKHAKK